MAKLQVTVCDECKSIERPTRHYRVVSEGRVALADLCEQHGKLLESFIVNIGAQPATRSTFEDKVKTLEEIEKAKRDRRIAARKS
ncbi:hypothetical protein [Pengzhenrongella sicca]|uniref:Uncharacterized protein n=1 Tax=Pengzhenrongella sicca TaxID=2819238 RepID=A0A8A4Z821_9MICO|nr:hypothetical protein [Pengzhenrongella sicca]QTE28060.1 hypothetical protein J4E96_11705 [Pengzhenrongella sicca]